MADIVGEHWIIEFYDCPGDVLDDVDLLRSALKAACEEAQLNLLQLMEHSFTPQGITMLGLLSESHISIHTWPEEGYAALDLFTCGEEKCLDCALEKLLVALKAKKHSVQVVKRGPGKSAE